MKDSKELAGATIVAPTTEAADLAPAHNSALSALRPGTHSALKNALIIGTLAIGAKIFAAVREVVIAWQYGISGIVDAFNISYTVVTWAPQLITSIMVTALVPHLVSLGRRAEWAIVKNELNGFVLLIGCATLLLTWTLGPFIAAEIAEGLQPLTIQAAREMAFILAPFSFLMICSGYFAVRLQARQRFGYTFLEALPPIVLSILVLGVGHAASFWPLVYGILLGGAVQFLLLVRLVRKHDQGVGRARIGFASPLWRSMFLAVGFIALGQTLNALSIPIDQILAADLGTGAVATLGYSNRLLGLITGLAITVIGYSLLPIFSTTVNDGQMGAGRTFALTAAGLLFLGGGVLSALVWSLARLGVSYVFERGAFTATDTEIVSSVFRIAALQLPFFVSGLALMQWIAAKRRYGQICLVLLFMAAAKLLSALVLSRFYGLEGLAWSQVIMYAIFALGMIVFATASEEELSPQEANSRDASGELISPGLK